MVFCKINNMRNENSKFYDLLLQDPLVSEMITAPNIPIAQMEEAQSTAFTIAQLRFIKR